MEYFVEKGWIDPQLPEERKIYADKMYAASVYSAGDELSSSSNGFEMQYARALRSTYSPPNRDALSGPLLDDVHDDVKAQVDARLEAAEFLIAVFDMWEVPDFDRTSPSLAPLLNLTIPGPLFSSSHLWSPLLNLASLVPDHTLAGRERAGRHQPHPAHGEGRGDLRRLVDGGSGAQDGRRAHHAV
jgi:hypothetical protein